MKTTATGLTNTTQRQPGPSVKKGRRGGHRRRRGVRPQTRSAVLRPEPSLKAVVRIKSAAGSVTAAPTDQQREPDHQGPGDKDAPAADEVSGASPSSPRAADAAVDLAFTR